MPAANRSDEKRVRPIVDAGVGSDSELKQKKARFAGFLF